MIGAVRTKRHQRPGAVLGRRVFEHRQRNTGTLRPLITFGFWKAAAFGQCVLDKIEALVEAIASKADVGWILPHGLDPVIRSDHVLAPHLERVGAQQPCQIVDR
jgi:hypothetical protein